MSYFVVGVLGLLKNVMASTCRIFVFNHSVNSNDLSFDSGFLLIKEFAVKVGLVKLIYSLFQTNDTAEFRFHLDPENLL